MSLGTSSQHEEFLQCVNIHNTSHSVFGKEERQSIYFQIEYKNTLKLVVPFVPSSTACGLLVPQILTVC